MAYLRLQGVIIVSPELMVQAMQHTANSIGLVHTLFAENQPRLFQAGLQNLQAAVSNTNVFRKPSAYTAQQAMSEALQVLHW